MTIRLSKEAEQIIDQQVRLGHFPNGDAVVEAALCALDASQAYELTPEDFREMELSRQEIENGKYVDFDEFAVCMRKKYGIAG